MVKFWRVARYEYLRHALRRRFLFALLSVPALVAVMALLVLMLDRLESDNTPVGYIDHAGVLAGGQEHARQEPQDEAVPLIPYPDKAQARLALQAGEIQAYYVLPADYLQTANAELVYLERPSSAAERGFRDFLRTQLLAGQPTEVAKRLTEGAEIVVRTPDGSRRMAQSEWVNILTPFLTGLAFVIAIFTTSGYLMQAVVEEKENRTMEMLVTSVSPSQMMGGKIVGIIGVGLTQLLAWIGVLVVGVLIGRNYFEWLQAVNLDLGVLGLMALVMAPGFVLVAALMAMVGATVTDAREGQQMTGLFSLPVMVPYWLTVPIMGNPNGPLAVGLSFFPLTAPVTLSLRLGFTAVPLWELLLSVASLSLFALGALWLAGRAFRLGMLRYGQRLTLREILGRPG